MIDLRPVPLEIVQDLCSKYHGYGSSGSVAAYAFGVYEGSTVVAAYAWQPPPPGAAVSVCPEAPQGVLALSRMVAVPKSERALKHVSKPLMRQMKREIDRTRYPVLCTYSDEGQGHTGYVYKCAGFTATIRRRAIVMLSSDGTRASRYSNGRSGGRNLVPGGSTYIQRWEHWICPVGSAGKWMSEHGWVRVQTTRKLRSGNPVCRWVREHR